MSFYSDMADTATELLAEFGSSLTVKRTTGGAFNPLTGAISGGSTSNLTTNGVITSINHNQAQELGGNVEQGDRGIWVDDSVVINKQTDKVSVNGGDWQIVNFIEVKPADVVIAYFLQVRK